GNDAAVELFRVVRAGEGDRAINLVVAVEPLEQFAVAVLLDDGVNVLEDAHHRASRFDGAEVLHAGDELVGTLAEEGDIPCRGDAGHDQMDERGFATALLAVEEISAPVKEAVLAEPLAQLP